MHMIGHDDGGVQIESFTVVMNTVLKNGVQCGIRKRLSNKFAEGHEQSSAGILKVRQPPPIVVFARKNARIGHDLNSTPEDAICQ